LFPTCTHIITQKYVAACTLCTCPFEIPGSILQNVKKLARHEIIGLSNRYAVIIRGVGGSNDVNRNKTMKGLKCLNDFVNERENRNVMIVTAPYRHDLLIKKAVPLQAWCGPGGVPRFHDNGTVK
jgi:hypothetical protein